MNDEIFKDEVRKMSDYVEALALEVRQLTLMMEIEEEKMDEFIVEWKDEVSQKAFEAVCDNIGQK